jgi:hypothetical protein
MLVWLHHGVEALFFIEATHDSVTAKGLLSAASGSERLKMATRIMARLKNSQNRKEIHLVPVSVSFSPSSSAERLKNPVSYVLAKRSE